MVFSSRSCYVFFQVPSTSDTPLHVQPICTHHSAYTDTLLSGTPEATFSSTIPQVSSEIMDPPLCQFIKLPDFSYSYYSSSFIFF